MDTQQFFERMERTFAECLKISKAKNSDYSDSNADAFSNFRVCEAAFKCPTEIGILVRMTDKIARIGNILNKSQRGESAAVVDESIQDTLRDLINYAAILEAYIYAKTPKVGSDKPKFHATVYPVEGYDTPFREKSSMEKGPD